MLDNRKNWTSRCALLAVILLLTSGVDSSAQEDRARVAVGRFEVPSDVKKNVGSATLVNLMIKAGDRSKQYKPVVPGEYLTKVLEQYRAQIVGGVPPPSFKLEPDKVQADLVLLPTLAKTSKGWLATAAVVNLKTLERVAVYTSKTTDAEGWETLPGELWRQFAFFRPRWTIDLGKGKAAEGMRLLAGGNWGVVIETPGRLAAYGAVQGKLIWEVFRQGGQARVLAETVFSVDYDKETKASTLTARSVKTGKVASRVRIPEAPAKWGPLPGGSEEFPVVAGGDRKTVWLQSVGRLWVIDTTRNKILWSTDGGSLLDGGYLGPILESPGGDKLFAVTNTKIHRFSFKDGKLSDSKDYINQITKPPSKLFFPLIAHDMKTHEGKYYSVASVLTLTGTQAERTETLLKLDPWNVSVTPLALDCRQLKDPLPSPRSLDANCMAFDENQGFVVVSYPRYKPGSADDPTRIPKPENILAYEHILFCVSLKKPRVLWQRGFGSPGGRFTGTQGVWVTTNHIFIGAGDLLVADRNDGRSLYRLDLGGKLSPTTGAMIAQGWAYLPIAEGKVLAATIDNP